MAVMVCKIVASALKLSRSSTRPSTCSVARHLQEYVNLGMAVSTERGLVVPVIRDADRKNMVRSGGGDHAHRREGAHGQDRARRPGGRHLHGTPTWAGLRHLFTPIVDSIPKWPSWASAAASSRPSVREGRRHGADHAAAFALVRPPPHRRRRRGAVSGWVIDAIEQPLFCRWRADRMADGTTTQAQLVVGDGARGVSGGFPCCRPGNAG